MAKKLKAEVGKCYKRKDWRYTEVRGNIEDVKDWWWVYSYTYKIDKNKKPCGQVSCLEFGKDEHGCISIRPNAFTYQDQYGSNYYYGYDDNWIEIDKNEFDEAWNSVINELNERVSIAHETTVSLEEQGE